jgi:hypothetical protein
MAHQHTDADDSVAVALSENMQEQQTQGRSLEEIDYTLLAESAMDAFMDYEDEINREYIDTHPHCLEQSDDESTLRQRIASEIRGIPCVYTGTEAIAFKSARELAARIAEFDEQD